MLREQIKADLPNFPDEVIDVWLLPIATGRDGDGYGWPPRVEDLGEWRYALKCKSLDYWRQTIWSRTEHEFNPDFFCDGSLRALVGLLGAYVKGEVNSYSNLQNGRQRFASLVRYISQNGVVPVPVVYEEDNGVSFVDGNHRIAALTYVRGIFNAHRDEYLAGGNVEPRLLQPAWTFVPPENGAYERMQ